MVRVKIEWAVVYQSFRETVVREVGFATREEAEAWRAAFQITENREAGLELYRSDAIVAPRQFRVAWRQVDHWHDAEEERP